MCNKCKNNIYVCIHESSKAIRHIIVNKISQNKLQLFIVLNNVGVWKLTTITGVVIGVIIEIIIMLSF